MTVWFHFTQNGMSERLDAMKETLPDYDRWYITDHLNISGCIID